MTTFLAAIDVTWAGIVGLVLGWLLGLGTPAIISGIKRVVAAVKG